MDTEVSLAMDTHNNHSAELNHERDSLTRTDAESHKMSSPMESHDDDVTMEPGELRSSCRSRWRLCVSANLLPLLTCVGIIVGFLAGFGLRELQPSMDAVMWIGMPGELFLRMLKLAILPLIVCSVITGTASLDPRANGKISGIALTYIVVTNVIACVIALVLAVVIKPGEAKADSYTNSTDEDYTETQDIFADLLRNLVPDNMIEAAFRKARTGYSRERILLTNGTDSGSAVVNTAITVTKHSGKTDSVNVLGLIVVCTVVGMAANKVKAKSRTFLAFFADSTEVILTVVRGFFWLTPLGVSSLVAASIAAMATLATTLEQLGLLVVTVSVGLAVHALLVLPGLLVLTTGRSPRPFLLSTLRPAVIGFASTSTAVAIPEMLEACERRNGLDPRLSRVVVFLSVTLNADGSALYITSAAVFIAQLAGMSLAAGDFALIGVLVAITSMAIPSVPSASIVTLIIILTSLNIPANDIALLFAVEWLLDRLRTACNVMSHMCNAAITHHLCRKDLDRGAKAEDSHLEL